MPHIGYILISISANNYYIYIIIIIIIIIIVRLAYTDYFLDCQHSHFQPVLAYFPIFKIKVGL
jgi:hypothetical protein